MLLDLTGIAITFVAVAIGAWFLGGFMVTVFTGGRTFLHPALRPVELGFYRLSGVKEAHEQGWILYTVSMLAVQVASFILTYGVLRLQDHLPLNPMGFGAVAPDLAWNTTVSFVTNTNWQNYTGEQTMSYLSQMLGLVIHNFLSAATGIALAVALIRSMSARKLKTLGNFYVDATRAILYILIPLSVIAAFVLISQGVVQALDPYKTAHTVAGSTQTIAVAPSAHRRRSKTSATMAAVPSMPTRPIPSRIPMASPTSSRSSSSCSSRSRWSSPSARWSATSNRASRSAGRWLRSSWWPRASRSAPSKSAIPP
jgi:potassium-transporting ATPase potassium-binding subunit